MAKFRNRFRLSSISLMLRNNVMALFKSDVPTYVALDIMNRLHKGEQEITLTMCNDSIHKSLIDYLNEYHRYKSRMWDLEFLQYAFEFVTERIKQKLEKFNDVEIEILELSDTDKRVVIKMK